MATIPISQIVQVNPGVLAAAGSAVDLNGMVLSNSTYVPIGQAYSFTNPTDVGTFFGLASVEANAATIYFNGPLNATKKPGALYFAQYNAVSVSAYLRSASLATLTLTALQALSGVLTITVDGVVKTSTSINLSAATSFSNAATIIAAAFTSGPAVTWDAIKSAFVFMSTTTGASSTISYASGSLASGLALTQANAAILSQGAVAATPALFMQALYGVTQNWGCFTTLFEPSTSDAVAFAAWNSGIPDRFAYVSWDSDPNALVTGSTTTVGYQVKTLAYEGTVMVYGLDYTIAMFILGYAGSLDFTRTNGRATAAFKTQAGLVPSVTDSTSASNAQANGYNYFGAYANAKQQFNIVYPGSVSGQFLWLDSYLNQIWLNANLQLAMMNLLVSVGSVPYNQQGYSLVDSACLDPLNAAINFGAIRKGVVLSNNQKATMQFALGVDASDAIFAAGFYLQIKDPGASARIARTSPSMTLYYADGGSIQQLTLASIELV
jgi:hypothetical protein